MTPEELALMTGYSRQTINKWVRKEEWETSPRPGVQGGKARLIHVDERVKNFILSAQRMAEDAANYRATDASLESLILNSLKEITPAEHRQMTSFLLREGISGLLLRLGIRDINNT
jgi:hypothetical protein